MSQRDHRNQPCADSDCEHLVTIWPGGDNKRDPHVKVARSTDDAPGYEVDDVRYYHLDCAPDELVPEEAAQIA